MRTMVFRIGLVLAAAVPGAGLAAQQPTAVIAEGPLVGDRAPDFSLPWASRDGIGTGPLWSLSANRGRVVVLAFYPKDFTPGCKAQMKTFTEQYPDLFGDDVVVVGINADSLETHARFAQSLGLPFKLLTDAGQTVSRRYGSADANGYNRRTVYVVDRKGNVAYVDRRFEALDPRSYSELKAAVQAARRAR